MMWQEAQKFDLAYKTPNKEKQEEKKIKTNPGFNAVHFFYIWVQNCLVLNLHKSEG